MFLKENAPEYIPEELPGAAFKLGEMFILTNTSKWYGAAGILDRKLLRKFAGKRSFYILPSSVHETIFIPFDRETEKEKLDIMVQEVNGGCLEPSEYLSDHSYFYDGEAGEIRMCA